MTRKNLPATLEDFQSGPAMAALPNDRWRRFVFTLVTTGCNHARAAEIAGVPEGNTKQHGYLMVHDPRVQEAILEMCRVVTRVDAPMGLAVLRGIAQNKDSSDRDRINAVKLLLDRSGLHSVSETTLNVVHKTEAQIDRELIQVLGELGVDEETKKKMLLGKPIVDAEFAEVKEPKPRKKREKREEMEAEPVAEVEPVDEAEPVVEVETQHETTLDEVEPEQEVEPDIDDYI
jgi:hypothetical protein